MKVYMLKNRVNNKIYIGKTTKFSRRMSDYRNGRGQKAIGAAIAKYGFDAFDIEILCSDVDCKGKLSHLERFWIAVYNSNDPSIGYNLTIGGEGIIGRPYPTGPDHPSYGKPRSLEIRKKLSVAHLGKKVSEETRKRLSVLRRGVPKSAAHAKAVGDAKRGKKMPEAQKEKLRKPKSDAHRAALKAHRRKRSPKIDFNGQSLTHIEWAEKTGLSGQVIRWRLKEGWPMERVLSPREEK